MRSKAPLTLLEQSVMLLVFALAAALCLKAFLWADKTSRESATLDQAVVCAQTAAENLKHAGGDPARAAQYAGTWDGVRWRISYDEAWQLTTGDGAYFLTVTPVEDDLDFLGKAAATVTDAVGVELFSIPIAWQEVSAREG